MGHGAIWLFHGYGAFAQDIARRMADTSLPPPLTFGFAAGVPFSSWQSALLGCDLFCRIALLFISILIFGLALKQDWPTAGSSLLYGLALAGLQAFQVKCDRGLGRASEELAESYELQ